MFSMFAKSALVTLLAVMMFVGSVAAISDIVFQVRLEQIQACDIITKNDGQFWCVTTSGQVPVVSPLLK